MDLIIFFLFAVIAVLGALGMVILKNAVHSAVSLGVVFLALAAMYILLSAPFIAVAQVMIYAGAILILFVFVIMLLSPSMERGVGPLKWQGVFAPLFGFLLTAELVIVLIVAVLAPARGSFTPEAIAAQGDVQAIGKLLFNDFLLPFEITSLLLLVAIVGVIVLTKKTKSGN
jgi:NADH-quinone oxidoreductase subunit J